MFTALVLRPGWNLVGVPPLSDGSARYTTHDWSAFQLFDSAGVNVTGANRDALIGTGAFLWDGVRYRSPITTLNSGVGYWIKNTSASGQVLSLVRFPPGFSLPSGGLARAESGISASLVMSAAPETVASVVAARQADGYATRDIGDPPVPGATSVAPEKAAENHANGGGCGAGSIAVLLGLTACFWLRRRRPASLR
jgi:hypothetical protein